MPSLKQNLSRLAAIDQNMMSQEMVLVQKIKDLKSTENVAKYLNSVHV